MFISSSHIPVFKIFECLQIFQFVLCGVNKWELLQSDFYMHIS